MTIVMRKFKKAGWNFFLQNKIFTVYVVFHSEEIVHIAMKHI